jgi:hypothetical protein
MSVIIAARITSLAGSPLKSAAAMAAVDMAAAVSMAAGIEAALRYIVAAGIAPLMVSAEAAIVTAALATAAIASPTGTTIFTGISTMGRPITIIPIIPHYRRCRVIWTY